MPVSVVVGGQFGSEGKGKVALHEARRRNAAAVVRVGGTNSGHTGVDDNGRTWAFRQLPAASLAPNALILLPAGSLVDIGILLKEVGQMGLTPARVKIDPMATVISDEDRKAEHGSGLVDAIGSTGSGTGAALQRRISRLGGGVGVQARDHPELAPYLCDTTELMREILDRDGRIVIEGTQGFGLSILHAGYYPNTTSRDTTAATFVGEAGLSPRDVDDVILVIRSFPIRVGGNSGKLPYEITWEELAKEANLPPGYHELTTATRRIRRVGRFSPKIVRRAIAVNQPTTIVMNHLDYVDASVAADNFSQRALDFLESVEKQLRAKVSWVGTDPRRLVRRNCLEAPRDRETAREDKPSITSSQNAASSRSASSRELVH